MSDKEEFRDAEGRLLPNRNLMSLISTDPTQADGFAGALGDFGTGDSDPTGTAGYTSGAGEAGTVPAADATGTAADTSASEGDGSVVSGDRSEQFNGSDAAYAES